MKEIYCRIHFQLLSRKPLLRLLLKCHMIRFRGILFMNQVRGRLRGIFRWNRFSIGLWFQQKHCLKQQLRVWLIEWTGLLVHFWHCCLTSRSSDCIQHQIGPLKTQETHSISACHFPWLRFCHPENQPHPWNELLKSRFCRCGTVSACPKRTSSLRCPYRSLARRGRWSSCLRWKLLPH